MPSEEAVSDNPRSTGRQPKRIWGLSCFVWTLVAATCAFVEFAGWFATGGLRFGIDWGGIAFIAAFAAIGLVALINAIHLIFGDE